MAGNRRDAELFEGEIKRRKRVGQLARIDAGRETVAEFARAWSRIQAVPNVAPRTLETNAIVLDKHIPPRLGSLALRDVADAGRWHERHAGDRGATGGRAKR